MPRGSCRKSEWRSPPVSSPSTRCASWHPSWLPTIRVDGCGWRSSRRPPSWPGAAGRRGALSGSGPSAIAIDSAGRRLDALRSGHHLVDLDPADDPIHARKADALVLLCTEAVLGEPRAGRASSPSVQMVVHVDYDVLTGANPGGRGHLEDGPALSTPTLRRLGCDATAQPPSQPAGAPTRAAREQP